MGDLQGRYRVISNSQYDQIWRIFALFFLKMYKNLVTSWATLKNVTF